MLWNHLSSSCLSLDLECVCDPISFKKCFTVSPGLSENKGKEETGLHYISPDSSAGAVGWGRALLKSKLNTEIIWRASYAWLKYLKCVEGRLHNLFKGIVHFEINFWYVLAYLNGIQDVAVFVSTVFSILIFLGQIVLVCQSYNGGLWGPPSFHLKEHAQRSPN